MAESTPWMIPVIAQNSSQFHQMCHFLVIRTDIDKLVTELVVSKSNILFPELLLKTHKDFAYNGIMAPYHNTSHIKMGIW